MNLSKNWNLALLFSMDTFEQFIKDVQAGNVDPYLKSEPLPEGNDEPGKVKVMK